MMLILEGRFPAKYRIVINLSTIHHLKNEFLRFLLVILLMLLLAFHLNLLIFDTCGLSRGLRVMK